MATLERLRVMVSSRSLVKVFDAGEPLSAVRTRLQRWLHSLRWTSGGRVAGRDEPFFDVWIHEDEAGLAADRSTYQISLDEIGKADIVLVLYTGEAGSATEGTTLGICHAELQAAVARRPEMVFMIRLLPLKSDTRKLDVEFRRYVDGLSLFQKDARDEAELHAVAASLVQNVVVRLASRGSVSASRKLDRGEALQWSSLGLAERRERIRGSLARWLDVRPPAADVSPPLFVLSLAGRDVLVRLAAIPGAASEPAAREMVGQPFLRDHQNAPLLARHRLIGPLHVVACHRTVTEGQAAKMLGTPDSMVVASDFGIFAADHVQKIQVALLARCTDDAATGVVVRRFREWLEQSGEGRRVIERADARRRILAAVAAEQAPADDGSTQTKPARRSGRHAIGGKP
jgi:hypothetical protein